MSWPVPFAALCAPSAIGNRFVRSLQSASTSLAGCLLPPASPVAQEDPYTGKLEPRLHLIFAPRSEECNDPGRRRADFTEQFKGYCQVNRFGA